MTSFAKSFKCNVCNRTFSLVGSPYGCNECGGPLEVQYDYDAMADRLDKKEIKARRVQGIEKWVEFLPIEDEGKIRTVSLGENATPLLESDRLARKVGVHKLYIKNESLLPTGSFKDRSTPLAVIQALEMRAKVLAVVSSGNAAASIGAYAARAGLQSIAMVDYEVALPKLAQLLIYGVRTVVVRTDHNKLIELFVAARERFGWYDCNAEYNPFRFEGNKTCAYEICDQFDWQVPDWVISPMGSCTGIAGQWKGFKELVLTGIMTETPHLAGVQSQACSPVVTAFRKGKSDIEPLKPGATISTAIKVPNPRYGRKALEALYESEGAAETATDEEIIDAIKLLGKEGIFSEPAGAAPLAAAAKLVEDGQISRDQDVVCIVTGHGLKAPETVTTVFQRPQAIEPRIEEIESVLRNQ